MIAKISRRTTIQALGAALLATCTFSTFGHMASADPTLRFAVYGDCRDGHDVHRKLIDLIVKNDPSMVFQTGDLVHRGTDDSLWKIYDDIVAPLLKKATLYPARGNHDFGGTGYADRVTAPFTSGNKDYYSLDRANCHFVILDVDEHAEFGPETDQYKWLVADLTKAKDTAQHIFVFFHVSPYSIGSHGPSPEVQEKLCPVFTKFGVRIVFTGHDHNYYHTARKGITYVVTGGGGAPLYDTMPEKGAIKGDKYAKLNHCCIVDVNGADVNVRVLKVDGSEIETFTVSAKPAADPAAK